MIKIPAIVVKVDMFKLLKLNDDFLINDVTFKD